MTALPGSGAAALSVAGLSKRYGATTVLDAVDLEVAPGEFLVFIGPSGSGKTSLMRMIAGLDQPDAGTILIDGEDAVRLAPPRRGVAMVFQNYALYPHMTVAQNMGFSLRMAGARRADIDDAVRRTAAVLKLDQLLDRKPAALSGGQRQRVAIGRALVRRPRLFLFDEPLSNLDPALREEMRLEFVRLHRELGTTMIYVTHDQTEAMTMGDRIAMFNRGRIEQVARPLDMYHAPATEFVATVLGSPRINLFPGAVTVRDGQATLAVPGWPDRHVSGAVEPSLAAATRFGVRPEQWALGGDAGWPVTVDVIEQLGDTTIVHALAPFAEGARLALRVEPATAFALSVGDTLRIAPLPGGLKCFAPDGRCVAAV